MGRDLDTSLHSLHTSLPSTCTLARHLPSPGATAQGTQVPYCELHVAESELWRRSERGRLCGILPVALLTHNTNPQSPALISARTTATCFLPELDPHPTAVQHLLIRGACPRDSTHRHLSSELRDPTSIPEAPTPPTGRQWATEAGLWSCSPLSLCNAGRLVGAQQKFTELKKPLKTQQKSE